MIHLQQLFQCAILVLALGIAQPALLCAEPQESRSWPAFHGGGALTGVAPGLPGNAEMKLRWTYTTNEDDPAGIEGGAAIVNGIVYVADTGSSLHAVDVQTGKRKWAYAGKSGFTTTPLVIFDKQRNDHVVLLGDDEGIFHAVASKDGSKLWSVETAGTIHASANVEGDRIVFGNDAAEIICLALHDGKELWKKTAGDRINAAPAIVNGLALFSGCDAKLRGVRIADGEEVFAFDMGALSGASPAAFDGRIYIGTDMGRALCISADGKTQHWLHEIPEAPMAYGSPAVSQGIVVLGARDRKVHAVAAADGKPLWSFKTRGDVDSSPAISGDRVYVGSKDKKFYVLDLKTGEKLWQFDAGRSILAPPAIGEGVVVVGDTAGSVFCFEPKERSRNDE